MASSNFHLVLISLLRSLKLTFSSRLLAALSAGAVSALALVLRHRFSRPFRYISDLSNVGTLAGATGYSAHEYDFIVIGGGTSGCALASRLSEDHNLHILLLEAGGSGTSLVLSRTPSLFARLFHTRHVHHLRTQPQVHASHKRHYWPRGRLLGGCSSINAQMAQYGAPHDFDEWAEIIGDNSWSWKNFRRYFVKFERYQPHSDYPFVDASTKGSDGPVRVGYHNFVTEPSKAFIKACVNVGIPFTPDFNHPSGTLGTSRDIFSAQEEAVTYIDEKFRRVSSESAYLTEDVLCRPNLTVAINAQVTRILTETVDGKLRTTGVEFSPHPGGLRYIASVRRDVVVCAGAVQSPQILMLSGIGPAAQLKQHNIPVVLDLPGVGSHLVDHPVVDLYFKDKRNNSSKYFAPTTVWDALKLLSAFARYFVLGAGGPLATNFGESAAFIRSDDPTLFTRDAFPATLSDSTSGPGSPDLELFTTPMAYKEHGAVRFDVHTYALHVYLLRPLSMGSVLLKSSDPWDLPIVNPNYLKNADDAAKLLKGVRLLLKIAQTEPLASFLDRNFPREDLDHQLHLESDTDLLNVIKQRVETVYHPTSTCRMAPLQEGGVVDSDLQVYGLQGLRVCDASIFPEIVSGHTAGACYAVAEKLADVLKGQ